MKRDAGLTEDYLDEIESRAASVAGVTGNGDAMGPHFRERAFQLAEFDVPRLVAELREMRSTSDAGS